MPPKKRATTVSPKKGSAKVEETASAVIEDIESEGNEEAEDNALAAAAPMPPVLSPTRRSSRLRGGAGGGGGEGEEAPAVDVQHVQQQEAAAEEEAPPPPAAAVDDDASAAAEAPPLLAPIVDDDNAQEEQLEEEEEGETREEEEEGAPTTAMSALPKEERGLATPVRAIKAGSAALGSPTKASAYQPMSGAKDQMMMMMEHGGARRVPRLRMDRELAEDVRRAMADEDAREADVKPAAKKPSVPLRRPISPPRTRGFTSAATLSATMKESKERLKRSKRQVVKEEGTAVEGEENVDVENEGDPTNDGSSADEANSCEICAARFPLHLEMVEHQLGAHKKEVRQQRERGSLMCAHPHCGVSLKDMHHQLAHLAGYHNQTQFRIRQQHFSSEESFMAWKAEAEARSKSTYIARTEELEIEPGVVELELYCECSEEWRNADKAKGISPIVACPAHFTVRFDRTKDKVSIIGCTSHLGHLKKPNWSVYEPTDNVTMKKGLLLKPNAKCGLCGEVFRSRTALTIHRRGMHPDNIRTATIACGDPSCDVVTDTMLSLCEHVADSHKREDLTVEEYRFNTIGDFEVWKERMEADTMSYFTKVSGRQRAAPSGPNSDCFFRYYQCHLSGYNQRPTKNQQEERPKLRNRGTKKMNRFCTAFMNIKINDGDGSVLLKGCLGHFGHECDIRRVPMPNSLRNEIVKMLQDGITEDDVLAIIKSKASVHDRAYYLQKYEVKNIVKKLIKESNGAIFYQYDDEMEEMDDGVDWQEMKRPFSSTMYRSMIQHPKRVRMGTYALQFGNQPPRKRRLVYRQEGLDGEDYYENVVEEMAPDMDEHVTYLDEVEMDAASSHHHMGVPHEGEEEHEEQLPHEQMQQHEHQMANEASTSSASVSSSAAHHHHHAALAAASAAAARRRKQQQQMLHLQQQPSAAMPPRMPLLKDGSDCIPMTERDKQVENTIINIRNKILFMTEQVKRCKDPELSQQMLDEVRQLEQRMARILPQTGPGRIESGLAYHGRRGEEEIEEEDEYYEEEMVVDDGSGHYYMEDDGRPGPSTMVVPRGGRYGHHEVIYQDVDSPGVEVDVEDLDDLEEADAIDQMNV